MNGKFNHYRSLWTGSSITLLVLLLPILIPSNYILSIMIMIGFYTIVCTGLTLLMGQAGQISLGHAAFYGIGGYTSAIVSTTLGWSPWLGILIGMIVSAIIALIIGTPTLKLKGNYLALATLGFGVIIFVFFKELKGLTGGLNGFYGIPYLNLFGYYLDSDFGFYYLIWLVAILGIVFASNMIRSRVGRALKAVHDSEIAANTLGINAQKYKLQVFVISAVYASVSGSLYAHYVTFINPELYDVMPSITYLIMVVIGGAATVWGGAVGAAIYVILGELLKEIIPYFTDTTGEYQIVFFGILLILILIYMPNGVAPILSKGWQIVSRQKHAVSTTSLKKTEVAGGDGS
ncbi:branched-chain amino acid ABC transporter permease [Tuberibacillus calidus]|uniref:branched-chain amino acid ABC transporter permease n=1 Tax=Tuberibacillus calidus TaxID=340097 RepID=UPI000419836A|nr:branched-chain amino acid ABC transporter permease [Tuberibacillus calidus]